MKPICSIYCAFLWFLWNKTFTSSARETCRQKGHEKSWGDPVGVFYLTPPIDIVCFLTRGLLLLRGHRHPLRNAGNWQTVVNYQSKPFSQAPSSPLLHAANVFKYWKGLGNRIFSTSWITWCTHLYSFHAYRLNILGELKRFDTFTLFFL